MAELLSHRCLNHGAREAAARCPACAQFFCRECITEHDGKVICATCLRKESGASLDRKFSVAVIGRALAVTAGFILGWLCIYSAGQLLVSLPADFHEGTIWKVRFLDER
ncbi:MAG: rhomboid family protein [Limisphaerales bacterium]